MLCPEDFLIILISVLDPNNFGKLDPDPDPHQSERQERIQIRISEKQYQDPDPRQSEKVEALEGHLGALEGPSLEKSEL